MRIRKHRRFSKRLVVGKGRIRSVAADYEERRCVIRFKVTRLRGFAEALGRRAHLLVAFPEPRMSKDYERLCATSEAFVYAAMARLMVRRLARS